MKHALALLLACLAVQTALSDETNLTLTVDGVTYSNVTFGTATPLSVSIRHRTGITSIPLWKLPKELQLRFGYDPEKIKAEAARAEAEAAKAEEAKAEAAKAEAAKAEAARVKAAEARAKAKVEVEVAAEVVRVKAEEARVKAKGPQKAVAAGERHFTVDVFIRTKGGENIKCGLVTVLVFDEEAIKSWQPGITKTLADHAFDLENVLVDANTKRETATRAWELAKQNLELAKQNEEAALEKKVAELRKARPDAYFSYDGSMTDLDEKSQEKAAPAAYKYREAWRKYREACQDAVQKKKNEKDIADGIWADMMTVLAVWPKTVSELVLESLPQPVTTTKTDADGRCAGKVIKPGTYAFCAEFSRLVGDKSEQNTWLIWVYFDEPTPKKVMLSNDNTLLSGSPDNVLQTIPMPKLPPDAQH